MFDISKHADCAALGITSEIGGFSCTEWAPCRDTSTTPSDFIKILNDPLTVPNSSACRVAKSVVHLASSGSGGPAKRLGTPLAYHPAYSRSQ